MLCVINLSLLTLRNRSEFLHRHREDTPVPALGELPQPGCHLLPDHRHHLHRPPRVHHHLRNISG